MSYANSGQHVIEQLTLSVRDSGDIELNLVPSMVEVSLFESIHEPTMSGYVSIVDTLNLSDILPLYGNEVIDLIFYTEGNEGNPVEFRGKVYKISERHRITEHATGYTIHFTSDQTIMSERVFVQKGYEDTIDNIVSDIYKNTLESSPQKPLNVETTRGISTYTFGAVHPIDAITQLTGDAISTEGNTGFLFYEDTEQFNFVSLQSLYQQTPISSYFYRNAGVYENVKERAIEQFNTIQDIKIYEENSYLDRIMDGLHGSHHMYFDLLTKKVKDIYYTKSDNYEENKSLGEVAEKKELDSGDDLITLHYSRDVEEMAEIKTKNIMRKIESETFKTNIIVFGDSTIRSGNVIDVTIPNWNSDQENIKSIYSGNVLIGEIRHTLTQTQYVQSMMVYKDSYEEPQ